MKPWTAILLGLFFLLVPKSILSYLLNPFPGSQQLDSITVIYYLARAVPLFQLLGLAGMGYGIFAVLRARKSTAAVAGVIGAILFAVAVLLGLRTVLAPVMFEEPETIAFAQGTSGALPGSTIVMGIAGPDTAKAYPIRLLAYHHRLNDELDGVPIWVTYCTMCRTGKVFSPYIDDEKMDFELVGAIQYNSVYRDAGTDSIWYQANGKAAIGPMTGARLTEFRVDQVTLDEWLKLFPDSLVFQPDPDATPGYSLFGFDTWDERRSDDTELPEFRWVVGIEHGDRSCAYEWAQLRSAGLLQDSIDELPIAIRLAADGISYRVWDRRLDGATLELSPGPAGTMVHIPTNSSFGADGIGQNGKLKGARLQPVAATVEFAHSFQTFSNGEYCLRL